MSDFFSDRVLHRCVVAFGCLAALLFGAAMAVFPGGTYNPAMRMLSALGRTVVAGEKWPLCNHLFVLGMVVSVIAGWAVEKCRGCRWRCGLGRGEA